MRFEKNPSNGQSVASDGTLNDFRPCRPWYRSATNYCFNREPTHSGKNEAHLFQSCYKLPETRFQARSILSYSLMSRLLQNFQQFRHSCGIYRSSVAKLKTRLCTARIVPREVYFQDNVVISVTRCYGTAAFDRVHLVNLQKMQNIIRIFLKVSTFS